MPEEGALSGTDMVGEGTVVLALLTGTGNSNMV